MKKIYLKRVDEIGRALNMKYRTKIDIWVYLTMAAFLAAIIYCFIDIFDPSNTDLSKDIIPIVLLTLALATIIPMCFNTYYVLEDDHLYVKSWIFYKEKIPYDKITAIRPRVSVWAAPVLSIFRIEISYGRGGDVLITPVKQKEFIAALNEKIEQSKNSNES